MDEGAAALSPIDTQPRTEPDDTQPVDDTKPFDSTQSYYSVGLVEESLLDNSM
jgi:hypothetical protein